MSVWGTMQGQPVLVIHHSRSWLCCINDTHTHFYLRREMSIWGTMQGQPGSKVGRGKESGVELWDGRGASNTAVRKGKCGVCVCVCACLFMCVCAYVCSCVRACVYVCMRVYVCLCMCVCLMYSKLSELVHQNFWWVPCQKCRIYIVWIWFCPTLLTT